MPNKIEKEIMESFMEPTCEVLASMSIDELQCIDFFVWDCEPFIQQKQEKTA